MLILFNILAISLTLLISIFSSVGCSKCFKQMNDEIPEPPYNKTLKAKTPQKKTIQKKTPEKKVEKKPIFAFLKNFKDEELKTPETPQEIEKLSESSTQASTSSVDEDLDLDASLENILRRDEDLGNLKLFPSPNVKELAKLQERIQKRGYWLQSPDDIDYPDEEDSLYNVPSLQLDPKTLMSSKSGVLALKKEDSQVLRVEPDVTIVGNRRVRLDRSHFAYPTDNIEQSKTIESKN